MCVLCVPSSIYLCVDKCQESFGDGLFVPMFFIMRAALRIDGKCSESILCVEWRIEPSQGALDNLRRHNPHWNGRDFTQEII